MIPKNSKPLQPVCGLNVAGVIVICRNANFFYPLLVFNKARNLVVWVCRITHKQNEMFRVYMAALFAETCNKRQQKMTLYYLNHTVKDTGMCCRHVPSGDWKMVKLWWTLPLVASPIKRPNSVNPQFCASEGDGPFSPS